MLFSRYCNLTRDLISRKPRERPGNPARALPPQNLQDLGLLCSSMPGHTSVISATAPRHPVSVTKTKCPPPPPPAKKPQASHQTTTTKALAGSSGTNRSSASPPQPPGPVTFRLPPAGGRGVRARDARRFGSGHRAAPSGPGPGRRSGAGGGTGKDGAERPRFAPAVAAPLSRRTTRGEEPVS